MHFIDASDPIKMFDFLTPFVGEGDMLYISESQSFIALPIFLTNPAETQYRTSLSGGSRSGGITCWSEVVRNLLRSYPAATAMPDAQDDLRENRQKDYEPK